MLMNVQSWSACAVKTPNYVWTVSFEKSRGLLRLGTQPVEAYRVIEAEKATYTVERALSRWWAGPPRVVWLDRWGEHRSGVV